MSDDDLQHSRALWNRTGCDSTSDEVLAQILDRGTVADWQVLYRRARTDPRLRARIKKIVLGVPLPLPRFWLAALASLGEPIDLGASVPDCFAATSV